MPSFWKHKTNEGRVVYNRKPKPFRYSDVHRILKSLEPPNAIQETKEYFNLLQCQARVADLAARAVLEGLLDFISGNSEGLPAVSRALEKTKEVVRSLIDAHRKL